MKHFRLFILLFFFTNNVFALEAFVNDAVFYLPKENQPYIETYLSVLGSSLTYSFNKEQKLQAGVKVSVYLSGKENKALTSPYILRTSAFEDTLNRLNFELLDLKRYPIEEGEYVLEVVLEDINDSTNQLTIQRPVAVKFQDLALSDIQLLSAYAKAENEQHIFYKNGYNLTPSVWGLYGPGADFLPFYVEIYNANSVLQKKEPFLISYTIKPKGEAENMGNISKFVKQEAETVNIVLAKLPIEGLPTGEYELEVTVKSKQNKLLAQRSVPFSRQKQTAITNYANLGLIEVAGTFADTFSAENLKFYVASLEPVASNAEARFIRGLIKEENEEKMRQFFLNFWVNRNPVRPGKAFLPHKFRVDEAEKYFNTQIKHGFETDRGRIYLKYGAPSNIVAEAHEPSAYPYQIWQYDVLDKRQRNVKFVFYDPEMATNDFRLIHSNAQGTHSNPNWKRIIRRKKNFDSERGQDTPDGFGSDIDRNFEE